MVPPRLATLAVLLLTLTLPMVAQTAAPALDLIGIVNREVMSLEICGGGSKLSPAEQQNAALLVLTQLKVAREATLKADQTWTEILQHQGDPVYMSSVRQTCRLNYESGNASPPSILPYYNKEAAIVRAHDPTVAFDAATKRIVTQHTLAVLKIRAAWLATRQGLPQPDANFIPEAARRLQGGLATLSPEQAAWYTDIERNSFYMERGLNLIPAARRPEVERKERADFKGLSPADIQWHLATATGELSYGAHNIVAQQTGLSPANRQQLSNLLMMRNMTNRQMQQNGFMMSHPGCGIGGDADHNDCAMNSPANQPLPVPVIVPH